VNRSRKHAPAWLFLATAIVVVSALVVASVGSARRTDSPYKVAWILVGPHNDGGWSQSNYDGMLYVQKALGSKVQTTYKENIAVGTQFSQTVASLVAQGYKMIFATSYGYLTPAFTAKYPDVIFEQATGEAQSKNGSHTRKNETLCEKLAHDAGAAGAQGGAHRELFRASGSSSKHQVGEIHARDEEDAADGRPEHDKRPPQLPADVILERDRDHRALILSAGIRILVVPAHLRRNSRSIFSGLCEANAGFEPPDEGDDVSPVAWRAIQIERRDRVDLGARREHRAEVEASGKHADNRSLPAIHIECFAYDVRVCIELASPPGVA